MRTIGVFANDGCSDFLATPIVGTKSVKITGLPFILEAINVIKGSASVVRPKKFFPKIRRPKIIRIQTNNITVDGNLVYFNNGVMFKKNDIVKILLIGYDKKRLIVPTFGN